ncbi:hypothetical protein GETHOR_09980 [Geothrix oryzae]|uniref:Prepilin-type N-terminal cleavage/methylation domain-containing protein n=1 Tax=Geothrix oryzae TaxID=2927975 RepID=A0ABN6UVX0_9BACT|nr:prepilin-type N-terminal cleavage/methylation domain-containing protein [Geothrix oryzae]BDU68897.1 hypothetical protein GETHOR_09980 [Geothrix oryzae]
MASPHPSKGSSGYSMVEVLVVLAIIGVLSLAYASYRSDKNGPAVRGTINGIVSVLVDAKTLARGTGSTVTLTPSGTPPRAVLDYQSTSGSGAPGQYAHAADSNISRYCIVDLDGSSTAGSAAIASLKADLQSTKVNNTSIFGSTAWTQSLFDSSKPFFFNSNGTASADAFIAIVGSTEGVPLSDGPVGIILINASGNIYRYYRTNSSSAWVRL